MAVYFIPLYPTTYCNVTLGNPCVVLSRVFSTVGDTISSGGILSVLWMMFSTVEGYHQHCGGILSVLWMMFSTMGNTISTVEGYYQY